MPSDPVSLQLTLQLAHHARQAHFPVSGDCPLCGVPWPCPAAERIEDTITALVGSMAPRAVGRAAVQPCRG